MNVKSVGKNLINKIKPDNKEKIIEEQMQKIITMMKEDAERFDNESLEKYAELIEEITELQSKEIEKYKRLINLTSHNINILDENNETIMKIKPFGSIARVKKDSQIFKNIVVKDEKIEVVKNTFGEIENLPVPRDNIGYIVSKIVANERPERKDLYFPEERIFDKDGDIIGCRKLGQA